MSWALPDYVQKSSTYSTENGNRGRGLLVKTENGNKGGGVYILYNIKHEIAINLKDLCVKRISEDFC